MTPLESARKHWAEAQERLAEIERVLGCITGEKCGIGANIGIMHAELLSLRKDKARLDWLEKVGFSTPDIGPPEKCTGVHSWRGLNRLGWTARFVSSEFTDARSAIDAAMQKEGR